MLALLNPRVIGAALLGLAALAVLAYVGTLKFNLAQARNALATERLDRATEKAIAEETARRFEARNARLTADHAAEQEDIVRVYRSEIEGREADLAAAAAVADGLRDALAAFTARGPSAVSPGPAVGDRDHRGTTLAELFREADGFAGEVAGIADRRGAQIRALKRQIEADRRACAAPDIK